MISRTLVEEEAYNEHMRNQLACQSFELEQAKTEFTVGALVQLQNLESKTELNGTFGRVVLRPNEPIPPNIAPETIAPGNMAAFHSMSTAYTRWPVSTPGVRNDRPVRGPIRISVRPDSSSAKIGVCTDNLTVIHCGDRAAHRSGRYSCSACRALFPPTPMTFVSGEGVRHFSADGVRPGCQCPHGQCVQYMTSREGAYCDLCFSESPDPTERVCRCECDGCGA
jgi:hypothetical protein